MTFRDKLYQALEKNSSTRAGCWYNWIMLICVFISLVPLCFKEQNAVLIWTDRITTILFIADYILRWSVADHKFTKSGKVAFFIYPFTAFALLDLIAILPFFLDISSGFKMVKLFRVFKTAKVLRILKYSKNFDRLVKVIRKEYKSLLSVCFIAAGYVLISALIMFQVEPGIFKSFYDAIYWAVVTLTTVGYGDIYPKTDIGRLISMMSTFVGIAIVAMPTGIITAGFMSEVTPEKKQNDDEK